MAWTELERFIAEEGMGIEVRLLFMGASVCAHCQEELGRCDCGDLPGGGPKRGPVLGPLQNVSQ